MQSSFFHPAITQARIGDLRPNPKNARTHSKRQIEKIAASFARYGILNPLIVDAENVVWVGNARLKAAVMCGAQTVPVIRADHLSPAELRTYALADNRLAEEAG